MAINQTELFSKLEKLTQNKDQDNFIFDFLSLYDFPKSTITRLKKTVAGEIDNINVAAEPEKGEVANQKGIYFKPIIDGEKLLETMDFLRDSATIQSKGITFIIVTDYEDILAYDVENEEMIDCPFTDLHKEYGFFLPLAGYEKGADYSDNPADVKAAEKLSRLFDLIRYKNELNTDAEIHALNVFLTRLLFCFFAEDTAIFNKNQFSDTLAKHTKTDGSDLKGFLKSLFLVLNSEPSSELRQNSASHFTQFPYVNGRLFAQEETVPEFDARTRRMLLECSSLNWSEINPDIFGSMFQAVIHENQRRSLGQHYTSVPNIMKLLRPLFLDPLEEELIRSRHSEKKLKELLLRLSNIRIFDPACGSGNFLIIAFKELRLLEIRIFQALEALNDKPEMMMSNIRLSQFYGIEIDDFAHEIALLSLWLAEHQMNREFNRLLHSHVPTLPLHESGNIIQGNSLRTDWVEFCPANKGEEIYVVGNPPFVASGERTRSQNNEMKEVFIGFKNIGYLDYVASWFWLGAKYIEKTGAQLTLVATNSITQGSQVSLLWPSIFKKNIRIKFAYQAFPWKNNAKDIAGVHVVIICIAHVDKIYEKNIYRCIEGNWHKTAVREINPYIIESNIQNIISETSKPLVKTTTPIVYGNKVVGKELLLSDEEKKVLIQKEPQSERWIRPLMDAKGFLYNSMRWCLWLTDWDSEQDPQKHPLIYERIKAVSEARKKSTKVATQKIANQSHLFAEIRQKEEMEYILVPRVSSERRNYIPIGFFDDSYIVNDSVQIIPSGTLYDFGILNSLIH
ncbi:MAG TPA: class I SAM-dependent DNA methyltransferase, partial [Candidatus Merdenecus merdavium]|nr:class I SAM-dependent DNA methyltransferase [Candidatus Merdenecus merdavium]